MAEAGGLSAPLVVRARLDLTRLRQEEATLYRATFTGSVPVRTLRWHLSPRLCKSSVQQADGVRARALGSVPPVNLVEGNLTLNRSPQGHPGGEAVDWLYTIKSQSPQGATIPQLLVGA
jgi:hypothetical protein